MTVSRFLPLLNLAGCLLITGIIAAQWGKERGLIETIQHLEKQLQETHHQYEEEKKHTTALENDVAQLKGSIEAMVTERKDTEETLAKLTAEREAWTADAANAAAAASANQEQLKAWEKAVAERDLKIRELGETVSATRTRLNEAITKLKEASGQTAH